MTNSVEPNPPAPGRNGRWVKLGEASVDSASLAVVDPAYRNQLSGQMPTGVEFGTEDGPGVRFWAGFGDGGYDVWAWVVDYGEDGETDERIAQVVVTLVDGEDLAVWRSL